MAASAEERLRALEALSLHLIRTMHAAGVLPEVQRDALAATVTGLANGDSATVRWPETPRLLALACCAEHAALRSAVPVCEAIAV